MKEIAKVITELDSLVPFCNIWLENMGFNKIRKNFDMLKLIAFCVRYIKREKQNVIGLNMGWMAHLHIL